MRLILMTVAVLAPLTVRADDPKPEWKKYTPKDCKCEIQFPDKVEEKTPPGTTQMLLSTPAGNYMLTCSKIDTPIPADNAAVVKLLLDKTCDGLVSNLEGKAVTTKDVKVQDKYAGRDLAMESAKTGGAYKTRTVLTADRLYQIAVFGPKAFVDGPDAKKFLDSFKIAD